MPVRRGDDDPARLNDLLARIDAALDAGEAEAALRLVDKALVHHPGEADLHHARGVALRGLERYDEALDELSQASRLAPDLADAWLDAAEILLDEPGSEVLALDVLSDARKHLREPAHQAEAALLHGLALSQLEDFTGALRSLDEAETLAPGHPLVAVERGAVLLELARLDEAEKALRASVAEDGDEESARAHHLLGFLLDYTGEGYGREGDAN